LLNLVAQVFIKAEKAGCNEEGFTAIVAAFVISMSVGAILWTASRAAKPSAV